MVQEGNGNWTALGYMPGLMFEGDNTNEEPELSGDFTKFMGPFAPNTICDDWAYGEGGFMNSEFYDAGITAFNIQSLNFTNCLFFRGPMPFWD